MALRIILALLLLLVIGVVSFIAYSWRASIAPVEPPSPASFDRELVSRGAHLSAIGNCVVCHTAEGGRTYAGGYPIKTPFGVIHGTNITPDPDTGIGRWSQAAFTRALREGVDREGRHLYPAFPYDHFTSLSDEDIRALYAYTMTREPVREPQLDNELPFPFNIRMLLAGWKLLFFERTAFRADLSRSVEWNRGAYLTQSLAHCGACHTPRNAFGAEKNKQYLAGADIEGWHAPAINSASTAPVPWTTDTLFEYLRYGTSSQHAVAAGPMANVVQSLSGVPESEVRAIAGYVASIMGPPNDQRLQRAEKARAMARSADAVIDEYVPEPNTQPRAASDARMQSAAQLYAGSCAVCHNALRRPPGSPSAEALHLSLASAVALPTPNNLIRIILQGLAPPDGEPGSFMPGFAAAYTDQQVVSLVSYLRASYYAGPQWREIEDDVRKVRQSFSVSAEDSR